MGDMSAMTNDNTGSEITDQSQTLKLTFRQSLSLAHCFQQLASNLHWTMFSITKQNNKLGSQ